jgi:hypothetical protein
MPAPFASSRRKIACAEQCVTALEAEIAKFTERKPYEKVVEPHPDLSGNLIHKIKLTQPLPAEATSLAAGIVHNLRSALDDAVYALIVESGIPNPQFAAFPFAPGVEAMAAALERCRDAPLPIQSLLCGFQPYPAGDDFLWALNELSLADMPTVLRPVATGALRTRASLQGTGAFNIPDPHRWDSANSEMVVLTTLPGAQLDYDFDLDFLVAFEEVKIVAGKDALRTLVMMGRKVDSIVTAIEAEGRRLGFIQ